DEDLRRVTETLNLHDVDTLFASLGYGALTAAQVVTRLGITDDTQLAIPEVAPPMPPDTSRGGVNVKGVGDLLIRFGVCCNPVPVNATLQVTSVEQLSRVLAKLEGVRDVFSVHRDGR